jgi:diacylglycerol O-acyltransferase
VHLKGGIILPGESVGNNLGAFVARVPGEMYGENSSSQARLQAVSRELTTLKRSPAALLSHVAAKALSYSAAVLPLSWASKLYSSANAGSIAVVSNNRGSPEPVHLAGRKVESLYGFLPLPPGVPVGIALVSYAGKVNCTVTAESWAVPDADQFLVWVLEEYLSLLASAKTHQKP